MTSASNADGNPNDSDFEPAARVQTRKLPLNSTAAPRKRRKRTVVSGAADDCFTCAKRSVSCDRRRPYCSQCLDLGQECSGYKTTLTWGMGVASRGKLRGLSLPVTGGTQSATTRPAQSPRPGSSPPTKRSKPGPSTVSPGVNPRGPTEPPAVSQQPSPRPDTARSEVWAQTPAGYSPSPSLIDSGEGWTPNTPPLIFVGNEPVNAAAGAWSGSILSPATTATHDRDHSPFWTSCPSLSHSQLLLARPVGRTPRLRYLTRYYVEVIAPMIVAFDSPSNPFRARILHLAQESESLQEAIATLAASNMRQRRVRKTRSTERTPASRMAGMAHHVLTQEALEDRHDLSVSEIVQEEKHHRWRAVTALNAELADPHRRLSDSVLATLLILCLFHVCDTGLAQFKTQFAGVTKLLAIRMRTRVTDDLKWFIRMFTWFDTMAATTNNRESHLRGTCLDITSVSDGDWGLENLAGCDSNLFRSIAQLGRLNLLSKHQTPQAPAPPGLFVPTAPLPPSMTHPPPDMLAIPGGFPAPGAADIYGFPVATPPMSPTFWSEWFSLRQKLEAWRYMPPGPGSDPTMAASCAMPSPAYISPPSSPSSLCGVGSQQYDEIHHVSEAFRHSAILYSERLAYPELPSSHPRIQNLVRVVMYYIATVRSDVYLLWPLFIAGSECVVDGDRSLIRQRCEDISRDSGFFNNLSCLELLERIWVQNAATDSYGNWTAPGEGLAFERGFRWQQAMRTKQGDGEYMLV